MSGFVLEEPFPLARFQNTIGSAESKPFIIGLNSLEQASIDNDNGEESDLVAITVQGEGFKLYNTTNQKCVKSWTTPPGVIFAGPVIHRDGGQDPNAFDYTYAIVGSGPDITKKEEKKTIWVWKSSKSNNNEEQDKSKKILEERVSAIHLSPTLLSHVIIVNESGSVELATNDLDRLTAKQKTTSKEGEVVWSSVFVTSNPCCIPSTMVPAQSTMVITVTHIGDAYTVRLNFVNVERRSIENVAKMELKLTEKPVTFTFDATDGKMTILGEEGTWAVYRLLLKHSSSKKVMGQLKEHLSIKLKGYNVGVAAITQVSENYVAMIAPRAKEHVMSVWEIKYGTLQAEQVIKTSDKALQNDCVYNMTVLANAHIAFTISSVESKTTKTGKSTKKVSATNSVVMLCPFYNEPVSLMAAMGKMKSTVAFMGIEDHVGSKENIGYSRCGYDAVAFDIPLESDANIYQEWVDKLETRQKDQDSGLAKLLDASISVEAFTDAFFQDIQVVSNPKVDVPMKEDGTELFEKSEQYRQLMTKKFGKVKSSAKSNELSQFYVSAIVEKCFQPDNLDFWPVDVVLFLLSKSLLRSSYTENGLVGLLIEREEWALLPIVLERVIDVPESDMVLIIKKLIEAKKENDDTFLSFLTLIANTPKNDIFLQQAFKSINTSELPSIIAALIKLFQNKSIKSQESANLVDFTNALVDIHFPALIMEPSLHESVTVLRQLMTDQLELVEELEQLRSVLGAYERKRNHQLVKQKLMVKDNADAPRDALTKSYRKKNKDKFGGEHGIPAYRVEVFRF